MAGRITKSFVDELLARIDIVEVINPIVSLRKAGRDFHGLCPFHDEKTPSFTVSQEKQFYHCFGCGAHGSAIGFLMNNQGLQFVEAVEELASMASVDVVYEQGGATQPQHDHQALYDVLHHAARFYAHQLKHHPAAPAAVAYLKKRGLTGETAKYFGIGFAPPGWNTLSEALGTSATRLQSLLTAGLATRREGGGVYDRLRARIVFPIHDRRGRVVGFGGRIIDAGEPKYLNSPETPVFHKRRELYGLHFALQQKPSEIRVVEGYMDVVSLWQHGVCNAVATLGTATSREQLELLFRSVTRIVFCFDGDTAGRRAAWRALETVLPLLVDGHDVGFQFLPAGHDPDSLVRERGADCFTTDAEVEELAEVFVTELRRKTDVRSIGGRASLVALSAPYLEKMPQSAFRRLLVDKIEALAGTSVLTPRREPAAQRRRVQESLPLASKALAMLLQAPELAAQLPALEIDAANADPETVALQRFLHEMQQNPSSNTGSVLERLDLPREEISKLLSHRTALPESEWETFLRGALGKISKLAQRGYYGQILQGPPQRPADLTPEARAALQKGPVSGT